MNRKGLVSMAIVLIGVVALGVVAVWYVRSHKTGTLYEETSSSQVQFGYSVDHRTGFDFNQPNSSSVIKMAVAAKTSLLNNGERLTNFDVPVDPADPNIVFLSAFKLNEASSSSTNTIYSYNISTGEMKPIFREEDANNAPIHTGAGISYLKEGRLLRIVGRDGSKLIILIDAPENSPGPCTNVWAAYSDSMAYLALSTPSFGLRPYSVPPYLIEEGRAEMQSCVRDLEQQ